MPRVNIWLPDELHRQAKDEGINISGLTRGALIRELADRDRRHLSKPIPGQLAIEVPRRQQ